MSDIEQLTPELEREIDGLVDEIKFPMQGKGQFLQGAALAEIVGMYFAGHHPAMREDAITIWINLMRGLIKINEERLFEYMGGKPEGWEPQ